MRLPGFSSGPGTLCPNAELENARAVATTAKRRTEEGIDITVVLACMARKERATFKSA
jgi:hypothetical protein